MSDQPGFILGVKHIPFNGRMRKVRLERGLTQRQLGKIVGIGISTISKIERVGKYPSKDMAQKIADALGVELGLLFPDWLSGFREIHSKTSELEITEPLLAAANDPTLLESGIDSLEAKIDRGLLREKITGILGTLSDREARVIKMRFGIDTEITQPELDRLNGKLPPAKGAMTLEEVARAFGVTRERIRQIEAKALRKLKHPSRRDSLEDFL